jgi:rRNA-processing protein FCF1
MAFMKNAEDINMALSDIYNKFNLISKAFLEIKQNLELLQNHQVSIDSACLREFEELERKIDEVRAKVETKEGS